MWILSSGCTLRCWRGSLPNFMLSWIAAENYSLTPILEKDFFALVSWLRVFKYKFKWSCESQALDFPCHPIYCIVPVPGYSTLCFITSMIWRPETRFLAEKNVEFISRSATDFSLLYTHGFELSWNSRHSNNKQIWVHNVPSLRGTLCASSGINRHS